MSFMFIISYYSNLAGAGEVGAGDASGPFRTQDTQDVKLYLYVP